MGGHVRVYGVGSLVGGEGVGFVSVYVCLQSQYLGSS